MTMLTGGRQFGALMVAAASIIAVASCFSEHRATAPTDAAGSCTVALSDTTAGSTVIFVQNYAFHPADVHVRRGSRVTWVNCETTAGLAHTSTANGGTWQSGLVAPGETFSVVLDAVGVLPYHCEPHPFMTGTITVE